MIIDKCADCGTDMDAWKCPICGGTRSIDKKTIREMSARQLDLFLKEGGSPTRESVLRRGKGLT